MTGLPRRQLLLIPHGDGGKGDARGTSLLGRAIPPKGNQGPMLQAARLLPVLPPLPTGLASVEWQIIKCYLLVKFHFIMVVSSHIERASIAGQVYRIRDQI